MNKALSNTLRMVSRFVRRYAKQITIAIVSGIFGIVFATVSGQSSSNTPSRTDRWALPNTTPFVLSSSIEDMLANPIFGGTPVVLAEEKEEELEETANERGAWTLVGIISEGPSRTIIFEDAESGRLVEASTGDQLPGGEQVVSIEENSIEVVLDNEQIRISLFWSWSSPVRFDGHKLTIEGECPDAENEEPVPCGIQGSDSCAGPHWAQR